MKTKILSSQAIEEILGKENLHFLIAFGNDGDVVRFVPSECCGESMPIDFSIPDYEIDNTQEIKIITMKPQPQFLAFTSTRRCNKYCKYDGQTYCCG